MKDGTSGHGFSEHHRRHVRTTFQYIDKLLSEAEHTMADAGSPSPFRRHSDDTTPIQRKVTHDYILRIREAMRRVMEELNIAPPAPHSGAVWAAAINLMVPLNLAERAYAGTNGRVWPAFYGSRRQVGPYPGRARWIGQRSCEVSLGKVPAVISSSGFSNWAKRAARFGCSSK